MDNPLDEPLILERPFHPAGRLILAALGAGAIGLAAFELWPAFTPPGWWSLPFGIILGGAVLVGGTFIAGALFGTAQRWQVENGVVVVTTRNAFVRRSLRLSREDVASVAVETEEWDSRADTYRVVLTTATGERFSTGSLSTADSAERVRRTVLVRLDRPGVADPRP